MFGKDGWVDSMNGVDMLPGVDSVINLNCHICGEQTLNLVPSYSTLPRVASDCVPWRSGGRLGICTSCLCVQNPVDKDWHSETAEVYAQYKIYTQSAGNEQSVVSSGKELVPRSTKVFQQLLSYLDLNKPGRLLDIGCANGSLLRYFGTLAPNWKMVGFEIDNKRRSEVESIPGVEAFVSGSLDNIMKSFDLITLIHVFEHIPYPSNWLENLKKLLNPNGMVVIQVPNPMQNPFNLLIADHCSHFIMPDLINIVHKAGYEVITSSSKWVSRELSILIRPAEFNHTDIKSPDRVINEERFSSYPESAVQWLHHITQQVESLPKDKPRGIWGTAIAATWLFSLMDGNVEFFIDEDANRIGQEHLGLPIYSPETVPKESIIFVALTPEIAKNIVSRWSHLDVSFFVPEDLVS